MRALRLFTVCILFVPAAVSQTLVVSPSSIQLTPARQKAFCTCRLQDADGAEIRHMRWVGPDGALVSATGRIRSEQYNTKSIKLYFSRVQKSDAGIYTCSADVDGKLVKATVDFSFKEPIRFIDTPTAQAYEIDTNPLIKCSALGNPKPEVFWRYDVKKIPKETSKYRYEQNGLRVFKLDKKDAGVYECRAQVDSEGAFEVRHINLSVLYPPEVVEAPQSISVVNGSSTTLRCKAEGNPPVLYEWYKEEEYSTNVKIIKKVRSGVDTFTIRHVQRHDQGRYICRVSNSIGSTDLSADIRIMVPPTVMKIPRKSQRLGEVMLMTCHSNGYPTPSITWRKANELRPYETGLQPKDGRIRVSVPRPGMSRLTIHGLVPSDTGEYFCTATNTAGTHAQSTMLVVEYQPELTSTSYDEYGWPDVKRNFTCTAKGVPVPSMEWYKGENPIKANTTYDIHNAKGVSTLTITIGHDTPWAYAPYACRAVNSRGQEEQIFHLKEAKPPKMPRNVTLVETLTNSLVLKATTQRRKRGPPVTKWMIRYISTVNETDKRIYYYNEGEELRVDYLSPDTLYTILVYAGNAVGYGDPAKFQARTGNKVQADSPSGGGVLTHRYGAPSNDQTRKKFIPVDSQASSSGKNSEVAVEAKQGFMGLIIGLVVAVIILLSATTGLFLCYRKRSQSDNYHFGVATEIRRQKKKKQRSSNHMEDQTKTSDLCNRNDLNKNNKPIQIREFVQNNELDKVDVSSRVHAVLSPRLFHGRKPTLQMKSEVRKSNSGPVCENDMIDTLRTIASKAHSPQNNAWEQMMQSREFSSMDSENENPEQTATTLTSRPRDSISDDLPPPPPYLLDTVKPLGDGFNIYTEVLDGYHSGDNVDTDEYFEIRIRNSQGAASS